LLRREMFFLPRLMDADLDFAMSTQRVCILNLLGLRLLQWLYFTCSTCSAPRIMHMSILSVLCPVVNREASSHSITQLVDAIVDGMCLQDCADRGEISDVLFSHVDQPFYLDVLFSAVTHDTLLCELFELSPESLTAEQLDDKERIAKIKISIRRVHQNLGHPSQGDLIRILKHGQASEEVIKLARSFECDVCKSRQKPGIARPASAPRHVQP